MAEKGGDTAIPTPLITVRGNQGLWLYSGPPVNDLTKDFQRDESKSCKASTFSSDGQLFAWINGEKVTIVALPLCNKLHEIPSTKATYLKFSPKGTYLAIWEIYSVNKETNKEQPNMFLYDTKTGECVKSWIQKKQTLWNPQWNEDESLCGKVVGSEILFYENNKFDSVAKKFKCQPISDFSLTSNVNPCHLGCFTSGVKGQPSTVRVFRYPTIDALQSAITMKTFFKGDKVDFLWNKAGTGLLVLIGTEVDKSGASYYGVQTLHYLGTNKDSCAVQTNKEGPIYNVQWNPSNSTEFCVIFGFMPAKAGLFNTKCEMIYDFGTASRNCCYYSPWGNMLILAGFGNLRGGTEVWDLEKKKKVSSFTADDTTGMAWCPDNEHILTSTTAPRLRTGNGFKIWHYTGSLLHSSKCENDKQEYWEVSWQSLPVESFPLKKISYRAVAGIKPNEPVASKQAYRPPCARGQPAPFKLHDDLEPAQPVKKQREVVGLTRPDPNKKKPKNKPKEGANNATGDSQANEAGGRTQEKGKLAKNLQKKLAQIEKLKEDKAAGKQLDNDQIEKLKREDDLRKQLRDLQVR